jgi:chromosomal replication initiation ATPase DnaA
MTLLNAFARKLDNSGLSDAQRVIAYKLLAEAIKEQSRPEPLVEPDAVIDRLVAATGIGRSQILGRRRLHHISAARHLAMWLIRTSCGYSFKRTGKVFKRDHTTVIHSCQRVRDYLKVGDALVTKYYEQYKAIE